MRDDDDDDDDDDDQCSMSAACYQYHMHAAIRAFIPYTLRCMKQGYRCDVWNRFDLLDHVYYKFILGYRGGKILNFLYRHFFNLLHFG